MNNPELLFYVLLPIVAFLYASVGHGGASGYLALMALFSFAPASMRSTALMLNILVSAAAFYQYRNSISFKWQMFFLLIAASVPAAFVGGSIAVEATLYRKILGLLLLIPAIRLSGLIAVKEQPHREVSVPVLLFIGAAIGLFSGLIGIGGGIILSPILLLMGWANFKETAAISALFIFCNSVAGLFGTATLGFDFTVQLGVMVALALGGGLLGAYFGAQKFKMQTLTTLLGMVLFIASAKLIFM